MMYYESELYHHGIRGQRWGVQNGPPYPLDKKAARQQKKQARKVSNQAKRENTFSPNNLNTVSNLANDTENTLNKTARAIKTYSPAPAPSKDVSKMTDSELKAAVSRMNLEQQYNKLSSRNKTTGADYTATILSGTATGVGIAGGIVSMMVGIQKLRGKG